MKSSGTVNLSTKPLTAQVVATVTGRTTRGVRLWFELDQLPNHWRVIEGRRCRVTTKASLKSFMRKRGIDSRVKWFSAGVGRAPKPRVSKQRGRKAG